jgi:hypothetical protein
MNEKSARESLFFHFNEQGYVPHSYYVEKGKDCIILGHSVVHKHDQFCRKIGRDTAKKKVEILKHVPDSSFQIVDFDSVRIHNAVDITFPYVIQRSKEIFKLDGPIKCKVLSDARERRVPTLVNIVANEI